MKKIILLFAALLALGQTAFADCFLYTFQGKTLLYDIEYGSAHVSRTWYLTPDGYWKNSGVSGDVVIPSYVIRNDTTYFVTSIDEFAFSGSSGLTSVVIGNSVTSIGERAFQNCSSLSSVTIGHSIRYINDYAFINCSALTTVVFNATNCIFAGASGGNYPQFFPAFTNCPNITNFIFGNNVTNIPDYLCYYKSGLSSVAIPNSVTRIGESAFESCTSLTSVTIPNSVTHIGNDAFKGCSGLATVTFNADSCVMAGTYNHRVFHDCSTITNFIFGGNVKVIPANLCSSLVGLTSVNIPNSVVSIGRGAFAGCSGLTSATIGNSVASIDTCAFQYCSGLTSITIPNSTTFIGSYAFYNCSSLISVDISNSVTSSIGERTFYNCSSLTSLTIGDSVTSIDELAFCNCSSLTSVTIPNSVTSIGGWAFSNCSGLTSIIIGNSVTSFGSSVFSGCSGLSTVTFNADSCIAAGYNALWAFGNCTNITDFTFGDNVKVIPRSLCEGLSGLTSVTIPASVTSIGIHAFADCNSLDTVIMLSVMAPVIESNSFSNNSTARKFYIPCGTYSSYFNGIGWNYYRNFLQEPNSVYTIAVSVNNTAYGSATNTPVTCAEQTIISAIANNHYHFDHWSNGSTANPDTIILTSNLAVTAHFVPDQYTVTGVSSDTAKGSVSGSATVDYLSTVTLTATANDGYHFVQWQDGNTQNPRTIVATMDRLFTATFNYNQYAIILNVDSNIHGSVAGGGSYNYLSEQTIAATANYGYHFTAWSDGDTNNPRTITLTQDTSFTALFGKNIYTITVNSGDTAKGTVTGSTSTEYLDSVTITANPNYGHHFTAWNDGNTDNPRIIVATRDSLFTATFDYNQYTITLNVDANIHGSVVGSGSYNYLSEQTITATAAYGYHFTSWGDGDTNNPRTITLTKDTIFTALFSKNIYTITAISADTIRGSVIGSTSIEYLDSVTIMANPNYGYHFTAWNDGNTDNPRIIVATRDSVFTASFGYNQYTITLNVDSDIYGSVVGDGAYNYMSEQIIIATANYGYHFTAWSDGDTNNPRTITLTQDTVFTALFAKNQYTLTLQSDDVAHGSVIGGGVFDYLDAVAIEATAVEHYHFVHWSDGNTDNPRQYVITGNNTIIATFAIDTHHVSVESCNIAFGSVEGSGDFEYGTPATVTATAYSGYQFVRWSNGDTHNPYTFAVLQDTTLVAIFEAETHGIGDVIADAVNVYTLGGQIVVETNLKDEISIYDIVGRKVDGGRKAHFEVPASGVYLVKIGTLPTQKVVVVK